MRKFFVKLFNLIYLAGAAVSIWALCTKPVVNTQVGLSLTSDQVADRLYEIFNKQSGGGSEGGSEASSYRVTYREEASEEKITKEDIKEAFPNGFSLKVGVKIEAKDAFNIKNKSLLKNSIAKSIEESLSNVVGKVTDGLHSLIKTVSEKLAKEELANALNEQINQYFEGATPVTEEQVQAIYDNVYNTINQEGDVTVEDLATSILGEKDPETGEYPEGSLLGLLEEKKEESGGYLYTAADPQPNSEAVAADIAKEEAEKVYYVKQVTIDPETSEEKTEYVHPTAYTLDTIYYVQKYNIENITGEDIADQLADSLSSIPGLVEDKRTTATPTEEEFNATVVSSVHYYSPEGINAKTFVPGKVFDSTKNYYTVAKADPQPESAVVEAELSEPAALRHYVVKTNEGYAFPESVEADVEYYIITAAPGVTSEEYYNTAASNKYKVKTGEETYEFAKIYDSTAEYFVETKIVNDVDTALAKLIEQMLGGGGSSSEGEEPARAHLRFEGEGESEKTSQEELEEAIKEYLYKLIPMDKINAFAESADKYSTYVVLGVIGLLVFPWALFALVTLIRTLRRKKCWTKPWIVFVFAFPQLFLGLILTYGAQYILPLLEKLVPQVHEFLTQVQLGLDIRTGCLIPSFIYCGMIVFTIIYAIFAHRLKVEYKFEKRAMAMERYKARRPQ